MKRYLNLIAGAVAAVAFGVVMTAQDNERCVEKFAYINGSVRPVVLRSIDIDDEVSFEAPVGSAAFGDPIDVNCALMNANENALVRGLADSVRPTCIGGIVRKRVDDQSLGGPAVYRLWPTVRACCGLDCECMNEPCSVCPPVDLAGRNSCLSIVCGERPSLAGCPGGV